MYKMYTHVVYVRMCVSYIYSAMDTIISANIFVCVFMHAYMGSMFVWSLLF